MDEKAKCEVQSDTVFAKVFFFLQNNIIRQNQDLPDSIIHQGVITGVEINISNLLAHRTSVILVPIFVVFVEGSIHEI